MRTLDIANVGTFDVNLWTAGSGSPVLFLHGYERHPGGAPFLQRLAQFHTVYAPEQPGYGTSTGFEHVQDIFDLVLFYRELVRSLGYERIDVIGHSTGGMVAAELAALSPEIVGELVLVDAFGLWLDDQPAQDPFGAADEVKGAKWHDSAAIPSPEPTIFVPDPDDPHGEIFFQAQNLATATKFMWPIADRGLRRRLPYVRARSLVVNGASDGLVPLAYAKEFVRLIPQCELAVIDDAGHYPFIEQEDEFIATVEKFLSA
ncbi:alpha/beta fold hydrolase [Streptomyces brasiliensis]|uniref:Alpha/beta hydrolase n=1 Tax=Streptomyces brasiliensis TaxID=1954 RepID=A0A917KXY5_9ACTN|nr:alpha/beta hydrolase [Streptomyces brasiliensis]GGJ35146.1 alpha/beta hydrolase [Streptomyces brasiliensis]